MNRYIIMKYQNNSASGRMSFFMQPDEGVCFDIKDAHIYTDEEVLQVSPLYSHKKVPLSDNYIQHLLRQPF